MKRLFRTVGQLAKEQNEPEWKVRRIVDALDPNVPRVGPYRAIPESMVPTIIERLREGNAAGVAR